MAGLSKVRQVKIKAMVIEGVTNAKAMAPALGLDESAAPSIQAYIDVYTKDPVVMARKEQSLVAAKRLKERNKMLEDFDAETRKLVSEAGKHTAKTPKAEETKAQAKPASK